MSAPWLWDAPAGPPLEIVRGDDQVTPPSVERLKTTGELPNAPWKFVSAKYTSPEHGLAEGELRSTPIHGLSVKLPAKPTTPGTAKPTAPRSTMDVPWYVKCGGAPADVVVLAVAGVPGVYRYRATNETVSSGRSPWSKFRL